MLVEELEDVLDAIFEFGLLTGNEFDLHAEVFGIGIWDDLPLLVLMAFVNLIVVKLLYVLSWNVVSGILLRAGRFLARVCLLGDAPVGDLRVVISGCLCLVDLGAVAGADLVGDGLPLGIRLGGFDGDTSWLLKGCLLPPLLLDWLDCSASIINSLSKRSSPFTSKGRWPFSKDWLLYLIISVFKLSKILGMFLLILFRSFSSLSKILQEFLLNNRDESFDDSIKNAWS